MNADIGMTSMKNRFISVVILFVLIPLALACGWGYTEHVVQGDRMRIHIKTPEGTLLTAVVSLTDTAENIKRQLWRQQSYPPRQQVLSFKETELVDGCELKSYNIKPYSVIELTLNKKHGLPTKQQAVSDCKHSKPQTPQYIYEVAARFNNRTDLLIHSSYDENEDGVVNKAEFMAAVGEVEDDLDKKFVKLLKQAFREADINGDDKVDCNEFNQAPFWPEDKLHTIGCTQQEVQTKKRLKLLEIQNRMFKGKKEASKSEKSLDQSNFSPKLLIDKKWILGCALLSIARFV